MTGQVDVLFLQAELLLEFVSALLVELVERADSRHIFLLLKVKNVAIRCAPHCVPLFDRHADAYRRAMDTSLGSVGWLFAQTAAIGDDRVVLIDDVALELGRRSAHLAGDDRIALALLLLLLHLSDHSLLVCVKHTLGVDDRLLPLHVVQDVRVEAIPVRVRAGLGRLLLVILDRHLFEAVGDLVYLDIVLIASGGGSGGLLRCSHLDDGSMYHSLARGQLDLRPRVLVAALELDSGGREGQLRVRRRNDLVLR